jgi:hypothetical protein
MKLDHHHSRSTYAKHIINWVSDRLGNINPREVNLTYGDDTKIELMTNDQINEFREGCLNDE